MKQTNSKNFKFAKKIIYYANEVFNIHTKDNNSIYFGLRHTLVSENRLFLPSIMIPKYLTNNNVQQTL